MTEPTFLTATRAAYDAVAVDYAALLESELAERPVERALLGAFAELVSTDKLGPVADLGCGPGRVTTYLHDLGLDVFGMDLSPAMVAEAGRRYPHLRFTEGSILALELPDAHLGGIVAWYSIIHTPPQRLPEVFAEFARVLAPGGRLVLAFQVGDEIRHLEQAYGHTISLDAHRLDPARIATLLTEAGFVPDERLVRAPMGGEKVPQAFLFAHKPADDQVSP